MSAVSHFLAEARLALASPKPEHNRVNEALDRLRAADLGLSGPNLPLSNAEPIRQEAIFQQPDFSVGLFMLRAGAFLPLHDHPRMTVWLKVLRGRLRVRSFDWVQDAPITQKGTARLARATSDLDIEAATPSQRLEPELGNLHEIRALEDSAFIDVFSPYYSEEHPCSYYRLQKDAVFAGEGLHWLEAVPEALAWEAPLER